MQAQTDKRNATRPPINKRIINRWNSTYQPVGFKASVSAHNSETALINRISQNE